jgi:aspartyl-tRNA(Asn)/glutamyl-tRNA(Gln) amidotransferase subunit A
MAAAELCTQRYAEDRQRPLEGVAIAVKSNIAVKGLELNAGMAARQGMIATEDAEIVARLKNAGCIVLGTLNMHEAALGATTNNPFYGACINPHGEGRTPGGSSGGSGAAVAAGLCTAALGTDTLGSVRIPAAYCGVFGLKPSLGGVSSDGLVPLSPRFDAIGPLARSMEDLALLTTVMAAPDLASAMQRARYFSLDGLGGVTLDPDVEEAWTYACALLPQRPEAMALDHDCSRIRLAGFVMAARDFTVPLVELGPERCDAMSPELAGLMEFAVSRSDDDLAEDQMVLEATARALEEALGSNGILVTPTAPQTAFLHSARAPNNQADFTALANVAGLPAVSIPIGLDRNQLPVGIQLIAPRGAEALLLAQARAVNDRLKAYTPPTNYW